MSLSVRALAAVLLTLSLAACPKPQPEPQAKAKKVRKKRPARVVDGEAAAPRPDELDEPEAEPAPADEKQLSRHEGMLPTAAEAELALTMGRALFEQAKFAEAEEQLKIASAGGKSEADEMLLRTRSEMSSKERLAAARKAFEENDLARAELELSAIPTESVLRPMADTFAEKIESSRERKSAEFEEKARKALVEELEPGSGSGSGIQMLTGKPTEQDGSEDEAD